MDGGEIAAPMEEYLHMGLSCATVWPGVELQRYGGSGGQRWGIYGAAMEELWGRAVVRLWGSYRVAMGQMWGGCGALME